MLKGCLLFFGVALSMRCVHEFAIYIIDNELVQDSVVGMIGEHIELSSWIAGEARRQIRKGKLQIKQSIGQICSNMGSEESERLRIVMVEAAETCRLIYEAEEYLLPTAIVQSKTTRTSQEKRCMAAKMGVRID